MSGSALRCWGILFFLLFGFLAILPRLLSTEWGNQQLLNFCNQQIVGRVEARRIQLHWLGEQKIEGLLLRDPQGERVLEIDKLSLEGSLFKILQKNPSLGKLEIEGANLLLHQNEAGLSNLQKALGILPPSRSFLSPTPPLLFSIPKAVFDLFSEPGLLGLFLEGTVDQAGATGKIDLSLSIPGIVATSWSSVEETGLLSFFVQGSGKVVGHQIPAEVLNYLYPLFSQNPFPSLQDLLGNAFDISLSKSTEGASSWKASLYSPAWKADMHFMEEQGMLLLQQPAQVQGTLSPPILSAITADRLKPVAPVDIFLEIAELALPLSSSNTWSAVAHFSWKEQISAVPHVQGVTNLEGTCRLDAPLHTKELSFLLEGKGLWQQTPLSLHLQFAGKERGNSWINPLFQGSGRGEAHGIPLQWWIKDSSLSEDLAQVTTSFGVKEGTIVLQANFVSPQIKLEGVQLRLNPSALDHKVDAKCAIDRLQVWSPGWQNWLTFEEILLDSAFTDVFSFEATLHTRFQGWQQGDPSVSLSILPLLFNCHVTGTILSWMDVNLEVMGEGIQAQFCGHVDLAQKKLLTQKGLCSLSLPSDVLQNLGGLVLLDPFFQVEATSLELQVLPAQISLTDHWLSLLRLEGKLRLDQLAFKMKNGMQIALSQVEVPWKIEGPQDQIFCFAKAKWPGAENTSSAGLGVTLRVDHWLHNLETAFQDAKFELSTEWRSLSFSTLSYWLGLPDLTPLFGHGLDLDLKTSFDFAQLEPGYWDMHMDSALFHAKARLKLDESLKLYQSNKPTSEIRWTLTPEGYQYLANLRGWTSLPRLAKPVVWDAYLTDLDIPLKDTERGNANSKIVGQCETTDWTWDQEDLSGCKGQLLFDGSAFLNEWKLSATLFPTQDLEQVPLFSASWKLTADEPYTFDPAISNIQGNCKMQQFPLSLCKKMLFLSPSLFESVEAFLGENVSGRAHLDLSHGRGTLEMHLQSTHTSSDLVGTVEDGWLLLKEPFTISTTLSPQLIAWASRQYGAIFNRVEPSSHQATLQIDPKNFQFPFWERELSLIRVGEGVFDPGKFSFRNQDGTLSNFITPFDKGLVSVWCTPIYFSIKDNTLQMKRWDCQLAGKYTLAGWGHAQLAPLRFNLTLGLHPDILQTVFHLSTRKNYLFEIPIKGRGGEIQINKTKVLARIGALATQLQSDSRGKLLGALLDAALSDSSSLSPPQPTTSPFPWKNI